MIRNNKKRIYITLTLETLELIEKKSQDIGCTKSELIEYYIGKELYNECKERLEN